MWARAKLSYWPYRGYGRWGRRVVMRNSPRFEDAAFFAGIGFDPKRLLVGDVDGDGVADLVYVSSGHITVWINQDGNAWSDPIARAVRLADMLGTGTQDILCRLHDDTATLHRRRRGGYKHQEYLYSNTE